MIMPFTHKENLTEETASSDYMKWLEEEDVPEHEEATQGWHAQESSFLQSAEPRYRRL